MAAFSHDEARHTRLLFIYGRSRAVFRQNVLPEYSSFSSDFLLGHYLRRADNPEIRKADCQSKLFLIKRVFLFKKL